MMPQVLAVALLLSPVTPPEGPGGTAVAPSPTPRPDLTPDRVVEIQLEALKKNDIPTRDAGIATTFRFASPGNRRTTGPLEKFAAIVKSPAYRPMIGHRIAGYGPTIVADDQASRRVTIVADDGEAFDYEFRLSKDPESGCWFTDGVMPIAKKTPIDDGKVALSSYLDQSGQSEPFLHLLRFA